MITTLAGKNSFELLRQKQEIISNFLDSHGDLSVEKFDCEVAEPRSVHSALHNLPFLVDKKLVVLEYPGSNKELVAKLPDWLGETSNDIEVLIIEPTPDRRTAWFKFLQTTQMRDLKLLDEAGVRRWLPKTAEDLGITIDSKAQSLLIDMVGIDQMQLYQELSKLSAVSDQITTEQVRDLIDPLPSDTIFNLLDSLVNGDEVKTNKLYRDLIQRKVDPNEILSMIGWQLSTLALIKSAASSEINHVASQTKVHPYVVRKNMKLVKKLSMSDIKKLIDMTVDAELAVKRDSQKTDRILQLLIVKILREVN